MTRGATLAVAFVALAIKLGIARQLAGHLLLQPRGTLDDAVYLALAGRVLQGDIGVGTDVYYVSPFYIYFLAAVSGSGGGRCSRCSSSRRRWARPPCGWSGRRQGGSSASGPGSWRPRSPRSRAC